jgi:hypothetical protein
MPRIVTVVGLLSVAIFAQISAGKSHCVSRV